MCKSIMPGTATSAAGIPLRSDIAQMDMPETAVLSVASDAAQQLRRRGRDPELICGEIS